MATDAGTERDAEAGRADVLPEQFVRLLADYERHLVSERDLSAHTVRAYLRDL